MKIIAAMDSFKGSLSSIEACSAVIQGIKTSLPLSTCVSCPVSDGGDGLIDVFREKEGFFIEGIDVSGPLPGLKVHASIAFMSDGTTAIIESAQACGISLLKRDELNPLLTNTAGVGEMIVHSIKRGCKRIILGLGGTATNDLGAGMLHAMGVVFYDENGHVVVPRGGNIGEICSFTGVELLQKRFKGIELIVASDVVNPLCGVDGAARTYAPQKGATTDMVEMLETSAVSFKQVVNSYFGNDCSIVPGAGAAGGMGFALMSFCDCSFRQGAPLVLELLDFDKMLNGASMVITGEGRSDRQTLMGKIPSVVLHWAAQKHIPVALLSGQVVDSDMFLDAGFCCTMASTPVELPLNLAMISETAYNNLVFAGQSLITQISL